MVRGIFFFLSAIIDDTGGCREIPHGRPECLQTFISYLSRGYFADITANATFWECRCVRNHSSAIFFELGALNLTGAESAGCVSRPDRVHQTTVP